MCPGLSIMQINKLSFPIADCSCSRWYISYHQDSIFLRCNIHKSSCSIKLQLSYWDYGAGLIFPPSKSDRPHQGTHYLWGTALKPSFVVLDLTLLIHSISAISMVRGWVMFCPVFVFVSWYDWSSQRLFWEGENQRTILLSFGKC